MEEIPQEVPLDFSPDLASMPSMPPTDEIYYRSELLRATEKLIKDEMVEEKLKDSDLWPFISKTQKLTFIDERDAAALKELLEATVCSIMRSKPVCELNGEFFKKINWGRIIAHLNINRAKGTTNRNLLNERTALISQFKQVVTSSQYQAPERRGFLSRIFGKG